MFVYLFIHLFIVERREGREKERERNINVRERHWAVDSWMHPKWGPVLQPRHVPWPGIKLMTFHFVGWHPINWSTPVRASLINLNLRLDSYLQGAIVEGTCIFGDDSLPGHHQAGKNSAISFKELLKAKGRPPWEYRNSGSHNYKGNSYCRLFSVDFLLCVHKKDWLQCVSPEKVSLVH